MGLGTNLKVEEELPFVTKLNKKEAKRVGKYYNYWDVKPAGDYSKDSETGRQYAYQLLRYISQDNNTIFVLSQCIRDMPRGDGMSGIESSFLDVISQNAMFTYLFREILEKWDPFKLIALWKENITGDPIDSYLKNMVIDKRERRHSKEIKALKRQLEVQDSIIKATEASSEYYKQKVAALEGPIKPPAPVLKLAKKQDETEVK